MAKRKDPSDLWSSNSGSPGLEADEFEELHSFSGPSPRQRRPRASAEPRRPSGSGRRPPSRRQEPEWQIPQWDTPPRRRTSPVPPERAPRNTSRRPGGSAADRRPPSKKKRAKKPLSRRARRILAGLTILAMAAATALLAVFLLFKVTEIQVTGDLLDGVQSQDIVSICGYKTGDNLVFLPVRRAEKKLEEKLPYVGEARITRQFPGTVEIHLTAARAAASVYTQAQWLYISETGKILEQQDKPKAGALQIAGITPVTTKPGRLLQVEDENVRLACEEVLQALAELDAADDGSTMSAGDFTLLDLSDLSHIRLFYKTTVEFQLGNVLDLGYKIGLGCTSVKKMQAEGETANGVMDLRDAGETKKAIFTRGTVTVPEVGAAQTEPAAPEPGGSSSSPASEPAPNPRQDGIPTVPFTG